MSTKISVESLILSIYQCLSKLIHRRTVFYDRSPLFAGNYLQNMAFSGIEGERSTILLLFVRRFTGPGWDTLLMTESLNGLFQGFASFLSPIITFSQQRVPPLSRARPVELK